ncbi:MAG: 3-deoxy-manno-octulosonate cytidylyltransferase [bacterium]
MKIVGIIPARFSSTRFPGKPLAKILDKPMIQWVYEGAKKSKTLEALIVATDSQQIYDRVKNFGGEVFLTLREHQSGTSRVAEVAEQLDVEIVVNVQGDEPLISPSAIDEAVKPLLTDPTIYMTTLKHKVTDQTELSNPNVVKIVTDKDDFALYFSRSPIPFFRHQFHYENYKHIGLYVYRKDFLLKLVQLPATPLEQTEGLEQLRVLENGYKIKVVETEYLSIGVDTEDDLEKVRKQVISNW